SLLPATAGQRVTALKLLTGGSRGCGNEEHTEIDLASDGRRKAREAGDRGGGRPGTGGRGRRLVRSRRPERRTARRAPSAARGVGVLAVDRPGDGSPRWAHAWESLPAGWCHVTAGIVVPRSATDAIG